MVGRIGNSNRELGRRGRPFQIKKFAEPAIHREKFNPSILGSRRMNGACGVYSGIRSPLEHCHDTDRNGSLEPEVSEMSGQREV